jgi:ATP phosphoribosyltransferase regulatory subunit
VEELVPLCPGSAAESLEELRTLARLLEETPWGGRVYLDFSVVNNMGYYSGIVFSGFLEGIVETVLSGGRYDRLMGKLGRKSGAIGFAVYLDLLSSFSTAEPAADVDVLLLAGPGSDPERIARTVEKYAGAGKRVSVQERIPAALRYGKCVRLEEAEIC